VPVQPSREHQYCLSLLSRKSISRVFSPIIGMLRNGLCKNGLHHSERCWRWYQGIFRKDLVLFVDIKVDFPAKEASHLPTSDCWNDSLVQQFSDVILGDFVCNILMILGNISDISYVSINAYNAQADQWRFRMWHAKKGFEDNRYL